LLVPHAASVTRSGAIVKYGLPGLLPPEIVKGRPTAPTCTPPHDAAEIFPAVLRIVVGGEPPSTVFRIVLVVVPVMAATTFGSAPPAAAPLTIERIQQVVKIHGSWLLFFRPFPRGRPPARLHTPPQRPDIYDCLWGGLV